MRLETKVKAIVNTVYPGENRLDLAAVREGLKGRKGVEFWRSLDELADTPEFRTHFEREFPREASAMPDGVERRQFLKVMGASLALVGAAACSRQPAESIIPYVKPPVESLPGTPTVFATAMTLGGYALGVLAENQMGRPVKIEGNPNHPGSLGATDIFAQASLLSLYDPDRSTVATRLGSISTWDTFSKWLDVLMNGEKLADGTKISEGMRDKGGASIRVLTGTVTSPTLRDQIDKLREDMPGIRWHQYEPVSRDNVVTAGRLAFGQPIGVQYKLAEADIILSLDSNFLAEGPGSVRHARDFAVRRHVTPDAPSMNRLYVIEGTPSLTGAMADHVLHVRPSQIETYARAIARKLGLQAAGPEVEASHQKWVEVVAGDLREHGGACLVVAGDRQPAVVHILAHAINEALGNVGKTVVYTDPVEAEADNQTEALRTLARDMQAGNVTLLITMGSNPVYTAPVDLDFAAAMQKVAHRIHLGLYYDETAEFCHWHVPEAHYLEMWSDARAYDGTVSLVQPLIAPLYGGKSAHELIALLSGKGGPGYEVLRDYWKRWHGETGFETFWRTALAKGVVEGTALPAKSVHVRPGLASMPGEQPPSNAIEVSFLPDPTIWDGQFANNGWLQELPKPLTKITWDNAVTVSLPLAERLGLTNFDVAEVTHEGRSVQGQVWIQPGHPDNLITLHLGYGRKRGGRVGAGAGFNAYELRTSSAPWFVCGVEVKRISTGPDLARTEIQHLIRGETLEALNEHGRPLVRMATLQEFVKEPDFAGHMGETPPHDETLFARPAFPEQQQWGMTIDLNKCTGCGACVVACQAENNIPVVGKDQVSRGRIMHWIRVDRYYKGNPAGEPLAVHQPVPCMQCENAPCEVVCPVAATSHSNEGLNDMVYNRCVGTRYCSNNCPYKVRRFNFYQYSDQTTPVKQYVFNPDVTVRSRGVMEKCTYCVQRINLARIDAKKQDRKIRDGEVVTACQAVCPAAAIAFGDVSDPNTTVSKQKRDPRNYALLGDLNTRPRTTYLAKLTNPNPELEA